MAPETSLAQIVTLSKLRCEDVGAWTCGTQGSERGGNNPLLAPDCGGVWGVEHVWGEFSRRILKMMGWEKRPWSGGGRTKIDRLRPDKTRMGLHVQKPKAM